MTDRDFWIEIRRLLLGFVDIIERKCGLKPRTKEIRDWYSASSK